MKKNILFLTVLIGMILPNIGFCQSVITGSVYFYNNKESAIGCVLTIADSATIDSIVSNKKNLDMKILADFNGNFKTTTLQQNSVNLFINYRDYYNTIIKNIPVNLDTIELGSIPLFIDDNLLLVTRHVTEKNFWGRKKKKTVMDFIGEKGIFSLENKIEICCSENTEIKYTCIKTRFGIEIDYNELKKCKNTR